MKAQKRQRTGIFECDAHTLFSSREYAEDPHADLSAEGLNVSLVAPIGGLYKMALNSEIFVHVWQRVFELGEFRKYAWSVKVDPDAVFLPARLRTECKLPAVVEATARGEGAVFNNCRIGNHGPIEVLSRAGVDKLRRGMHRCIHEDYAPFDQVGEDVFVRRCVRSLGVISINDYTLLSEIDCFENPSPCTSSKVVFHPFKTTSEFMKCFSEATDRKPGCWMFGCRGFDPAQACQCTDLCAKFDNCCKDYSEQCVKAELPKLDRPTRLKNHTEQE